MDTRPLPIDDPSIAPLESIKLARSAFRSPAPHIHTYQATASS